MSARPDNSFSDIENNNNYLCKRLTFANILLFKRPPVIEQWLNIFWERGRRRNFCIVCGRCIAVVCNSIVGIPMLHQQTKSAIIFFVFLPPFTLVIVSWGKIEKRDEREREKEKKSECQQVSQLYVHDVIVPLKVY